MLTFKKTIACLMSLIMIMTVTPFTAVTASAATAKSVSSNIDETNKKYHAAPSKTFTPKTGMSEVSWLNSAEVNEVSSSDGKFHKQSYAPSSNVLYWPSAYVGTTDCLQFQKNHLDFRAYYPSAVLMWDGTTDAYMPIMCIAQNTNKIDRRRVIYYAAPYDSERISNATSPAHSANFYADTWRGTKVEQNENFNGNMYGNNTPFGFEAKVLTEFISTGENANKCYSFGTDIGSRDLASFLHIDSNIDNDTSFISNGFLAKKLYWTTNSSNVDFTTAYDNNSKESSSTIYVVNYKPIVTAANEAAKDLESFDQTLYTPDAVNEYYKAIQDLYDCDPNSSFNQKDGKDVTDISDTAAKVANCANDIKNRVSAYEKAKLKLESSKQYRIKFTNSNTDLLSDNYYKAGDTIVAPVLSDSYEDCDKTGHCTVTFEWQPAFEKTASKNVAYVETKIVPAKTPHNYGAYSQITQDGKNGHIRTCSECGYKDWALCDYKKKSSTPATCTQDEQIIYECSVCHSTKTEVGEKKTGHQYGEATVHPATCTEDEYSVRICSVCNHKDVVTKEGTKLGHSYIKNVVAPTCTEQGYTIYKCKNCGDTYKDDYVKAKGHDFSNNAQFCLNGCGTANPNYVAPSQPAPNPTPSTPSTPSTPATPSIPANPAPSAPPLTPGESTIANSYGVDSATAKLIYIYLTQNNISSETSSLTEKVMTGTPVKGDGDYKGSNFGLLKAKTTKITKKSVTVKWNKVKNADGYIVYGAKCGAKSKYKVLKVVSGKTTSYTQKKLKKGTYYKYNIVAFKNINGAKVTTAVSKKIHATTLGGKYGVAKAVKVNKTKATIKKGKTFKIKASEIKKDKKIRRHRAICYESSNTKIATVNSKGKVKGVKKGKCTIYVYAQNGVYKTVNIKVK